jgi:hypothetical protein
VDGVQLNDVRQVVDIYVSTAASPADVGLA